MKISWFKLGRIIALLLGIGFGLALPLAGRQELSWAAPGQRPDQQTVPPRPPTDTPAPPAAATTPPQDNDDDNNPTLEATLAVTPEIVSTAVPESSTASPGAELDEARDDVQSPVEETPAQDQTGLGPVGAEHDNTKPPLPDVTPELPGDGPQNGTHVEITPAGVKATDEAQLDAFAGGIVSGAGWGVLYWLYALILGAALILLGMFLIRKS